MWSLCRGTECKQNSKKKSPKLTSFTSSPRTILTKDGELFILLAGRPADEDYLGTLSQLQAAMSEAKSRVSFASRLGKNRRGDYRAISVGVTHGGGSKVSFT